MPVGPALNPLLQVVSDLRKRRAIKRYRTELAPQLRRAYGRGPYTPAQVQDTLHRYGWPDSPYIAYALAMFCTGDAFKAFIKDRGSPSGWDGVDAIDTHHHTTFSDVGVDWSGGDAGGDSSDGGGGAD